MFEKGTKNIDDIFGFTQNPMDHYNRRQRREVDFYLIIPWTVLCYIGEFKISIKSFFFQQLKCIKADKSTKKINFYPF